ncbi:hypothetical protein Ancab_022478 [Ancistrocladus abbreviatus]
MLEGFLNLQMGVDVMGVWPLILSLVSSTFAAAIVAGEVFLTHEAKDTRLISCDPASYMVVFATLLAMVVVAMASSALQMLFLLKAAVSDSEPDTEPASEDA